MALLAYMFIVVGYYNYYAAVRSSSVPLSMWDLYFNNINEHKVLYRQLNDMDIHALDCTFSLACEYKCLE